MQLPDEDDIRSDDYQPVDLFVRGVISRNDEDNPTTTETRDDLHLHEYCLMFENREFYAKEFHQHKLKIFDGPLRRMGLYWPFVILAATVAIFVGAEFTALTGLSQYVPAVTETRAYVLLGTGLLWLLLLSLLNYAGIISRDEFVTPLMVYGLLGWLGLMVTISIVIVFFSNAPSELPKLPIFTSGLLLAMLLGGMIGYDLMIRGENLFWNLDLKNIIENPEGYREFRQELKQRLKLTIPFTDISIAPVFGALFVLQFGVFWLLTSGPQSLNSTIGLAINLLLDFFMMAAVFQFLIGLQLFRPLLTTGVDTSEGKVELVYRPFHPDNHGGFRDLGRVAMRINTMLALGGFYYAYRLYVQGSRAFVPGMMDSVSLSLIIWIVNYVSPIVLYVLLAAIWLYSTFWQLHLLMSHHKERLVLAKQQRERDSEADTPIGDVVDERAWNELRDAPEWPIDRRQISTALFANSLPVLLSISNIPFI